VARLARLVEQLDLRRLQAAFDETRQAAPPEPAALAEVQLRGQLLFYYDQAATRASLALLRLSQEHQIPHESAVQGYVVIPGENGLRVGFGRATAERDAFLLAVEVELDDELDVIQIFVADELEPGDPAYLERFLAVEAAIDRFEFRDWPYNFIVIPADEDELFAYILPSPIDPGFYPLGGDARYRFDPRTRSITDETILHPNIQMMASVVDGEPARATLSVALDQELPVETDVYLALSRQAAIPHYVMASDWAFRIDPDGTITPIAPDEFDADFQ
jgi:hypothetical protein